MIHKSIIKTKIDYYNTLLENVYIHSNKIKLMELYSSNDIHVCSSIINNIRKKLDTFNELIDSKQESYIKKNEKIIIEKLQDINNLFFNLIKSYGVQDIQDVLNIVFGTKYYIDIIDDSQIKQKLDLLKKFGNCLRFKVLSRNNKKLEIKKISKTSIMNDSIFIENCDTLECFDSCRTNDDFYEKIFGMKCVFQNVKDNKTLIVDILLENINTSIIKTNYTWLQNKYNVIVKETPDQPLFKSKEFTHFVNLLSLKELCVYSEEELYGKFMGYTNQNDLFKQKPISQIVNEFMNETLYNQRKQLIHLLIKHNDPEYQYLSYLLYDLLSNDDNGTIDAANQIKLYNTLPWNVKKLFKTAMKTTINYTMKLSNFDANNIPLEQQICLMKVSDSIKEKAMVKLKEVKSKSEDSGSKARQYLEGLLKIPFGIYRKEPVLQYIEDCNILLKNIIQQIQMFAQKSSYFNNHNELTNQKLKDNILNLNDVAHNVNEFKELDDVIKYIEIKESYTSLEIYNIVNIMERIVKPFYEKQYINSLIEHINQQKRNNLIFYIQNINIFIKHHSISHKKLIHSGKKSTFMKKEIIDFIQKYYTPQLKEKMNTSLECFKSIPILNIPNTIDILNNKWNKIKTTMESIRKTLDDSIYGHNKAKRQIEMIIAQWISGEQNGYCFGFEGAPGIGKTTLAKKGLAKCLMDAENTPRPFGFIAIGGSSKGSILEGHNYTYVGSTWGRIVDILIESKCMNPIIFIDELDKISKTEHGKEIIGILTHLVDTTQNDTFQDKYFNGIDIDLSKALFIFSYNDVDLIDRILLDRIHRIKFEHLTIHEKITIAKNYLLPEILKKTNLVNSIVFGDDVIEYIIEQYTYESGVRKLKQLLFEIVGQINMELLCLSEMKEQYNNQKSICITKEQIETKYLTDHNKMVLKKIHSTDSVGIINGLYANSLGLGGITLIQAHYFPTKTILDLKLTGMQGDVMKESMNVAKTLAFNLLSSKQQKTVLKKIGDSDLQGIHIHCPEGAVPKDGPSAGTAITCCIYSLLTGRKIKRNIAITGEISLQGDVMKIGGLDSKLFGGIKCGVTEFIFPKDNEPDFKRFLKKYEDQSFIETTKFHSVEHVDEVLKIILV
jgi:ATP-dependent Lon protease